MSIIWAHSLSWALLKSETGCSTKRKYGASCRHHSVASPCPTLRCWLGHTAPWPEYTLCFSMHRLTVSQVKRLICKRPKSQLKHLSVDTPLRLGGNSMTVL